MVKAQTVACRWRESNVERDRRPVSAIQWFYNADNWKTVFLEKLKNWNLEDQYQKYTDFMLCIQLKNILILYCNKHLGYWTYQLFSNPHLTHIYHGKGSSSEKKCKKHKKIHRRPVSEMHWFYNVYKCKTVWFYIVINLNLPYKFNVVTWTTFTMVRAQAVACRWRESSVERN